MPGERESGEEHRRHLWLQPRAHSSAAEGLDLRVSKRQTLTSSGLGTALGGGRGDGTGALGGVEGRALGDGGALGAETDDLGLVVPVRLHAVNAGVTSGQVVRVA